MTRRRGRHSLGVVTITTAQAQVIAQALADAEQYRRKRAPDWCGDCAATPAGACDHHLDDLDQADAYRDLAAELAHVLPGPEEGALVTTTAGHVGVVYLLHFDRPYEHARHYTGWTESSGSLKARLARHAQGDGARLLAVVHAAGIGWQLARTWAGPRARERQLKRQGGACRRCPLCHQDGRLSS